MLPYLLVFSRIALGLLFAYSFVTKARDMTQFAGTIGRFDLLPRRWNKIAALLFLSWEAAVVVLIVVGGWLLPLAFALAGLLLLLFTLAILSVLRRNIEIACNCFGTSDKLLAYYDVWRNVGFLFLATAGWVVAGIQSGSSAELTLLELTLMNATAVTFLVVWANLGELLALFQPT